MADPISRDDAKRASATTGVGAAGSASSGTTGVSGSQSNLAGTTAGSSVAGTGVGTDARLEDRAGMSPRSGGQGQQRGARIVGDTTSDHGGPGPRLMTADTLIGNQVVNHQGDTLGEIEDIMLDVPNGRIAYAVMAAGGFLGMGEKLFALPWSSLTLDTTRKCFVLDADKERIRNAPGFDKDQWPSQADRSWQEEVHTYYQARPYWDDAL